MSGLRFVSVAGAFAGFLALAAFALGAAGWPAENKAIVRRVFDEIFNRGRYEVAAETYAPDLKNHGSSRDADLQEDQAAVRAWRAAAPDLVMTVDEEIAENDKVAVLWPGVGTDTGSASGPPASGKRMKVRGITIWRLKDGRIAKEWSEFSKPNSVQ